MITELLWVLGWLFLWPPQPPHALQRSSVQIEWDSSTLRRVSPPEYRLSNYARAIQLPDKSLICVYEADYHIVAVKSRDSGVTWSEPVIVAAPANGINMCVPDILALRDGSLLVCYNPRPRPVQPSKKFAIRTKKSYDGGLTWKDERLLYEAGYRFEDGCWEPAAIQLPNGEIQLYFSDEGVYLQSKEQNISLFRSRDGGLTWTKKPEIASFRAGERDGMPSPLLLKNGREIVFSIEDNWNNGPFKPSIIRSKVKNNWSSTVTADSPNRQYALAEPIAPDAYAGAPYLRQLSTGEVLLSYQGTENRMDNKMEHADMKVAVGRPDATGFTHKSVPFRIPPDCYCLWNSLCVLDDDSFIALASTNGYSEGHRKMEIWMIKGRLKRP